MKALTSSKSSAKVYLQTNTATRQDCYCESRQNLNGAGAGGDSGNLRHLGFFYSHLGGDAFFDTKKAGERRPPFIQQSPIKRRYTHGL
ncbi:hypothetical protein [Bacillus spizizenii]|uniref:hypothetical protein n=1 Tax=Bacillus spizizenii TaxID=96241 RepID=UPI0013FD2947|nr:hypothetical protein [Bacillus spizizenii]